MNDDLDVLIVGAGLGGLTVAIAAARQGLKVAVVGDGEPGASRSNFGQLHSGAVYAPVLPELARACWEHRGEWQQLATRAMIGEPFGYGCFSTTEAAARYTTAWQELGIDTEPIRLRRDDVWPPPVVTIRLPDFSVDLDQLHRLTVAAALANGVRLLPSRHVALRRDPASTLVTLDAAMPTARTTVLIAGSAAPSLLSRAGIKHTMTTRRIAWATALGMPIRNLRYWLDDDLLAVSPGIDGVRIGLPGVDGHYGSTGAEICRVQRSLERHRLTPGIGRPDLHWGTVCEPATGHADPATFVADLRHPPPGWTAAANLIVASPGKWTTAWSCASRIIAALS